MDVRNINIHPTAQESGEAAAKKGGKLIQDAIRENGQARIIVATGASQFEMLKPLIQNPDIDWSKVTIFHLDEYVGLPMTHPASFRLYLWKRFITQLPLPPAAFHFINGENDPQAECKRVGDLIQEGRIDVAFVGIGENGHLAFNDPPADFETKIPYLVVTLDAACRNQQLGEGWFPTINDVPEQAISMSINQIMDAKSIICTVPDARKAQAVKNCLTNEISPMDPSSILRRHADTHYYFDQHSAAKIK